MSKLVWGDPLWIEWISLLWGTADHFAASRLDLF